VKEDTLEFQAYQQLLASATNYVDQLNVENELNIDYYLRNPMGNEVDNESHAVSSDCFDVVESDMPGLVRALLGGANIMEFKSDNPDDEGKILEAQQKTKLVNKLILGQEWSYKVFADWLKAAEIYNFAAVTYYAEDSEEREILSYEGITKIELDAIVGSFEESDNISRVEIMGDDDEEDTFDIDVHIYREVRNYRIQYIHPDDFLISNGGPTIDDCDFVGHRSRVTKGYLISIGITKKVVEGLTSSEGDSFSQQQSNSGRNIQDKQLDAVNGDDQLNVTPLWYMEEVELVTACVKFATRSGHLQRRRIMSVGNTIIEDEPFDHVNYAVLSSYPIPGQVIGLSRVGVTRENQRQKTLVVRGMYNNIASVNKPMTAININRELGTVNADDMLNRRVNGIVRVNGSPMQSIMPLVTPSISAESLSLIQYMDFTRAQSTGATMASQGLNRDDIYKETAARFNGVSDEGAAKLELVVRNYVETGIRKLYSGMEWTVRHYQDSLLEETILGEQIAYNPSDWRYKSRLGSNVGLGSGDTDELISNLGVILQTQKELKAAGSLIVDDAKIYNTLIKILSSMNVHDNPSYFNNPEIPAATSQAQVEQLTQLVAQLQGQVEQGSIAQASKDIEATRAETKLIEAQAREIGNAAKLKETQRQFDAELVFKSQQHREDYVKDLTELQLKYGTDVPGDLIDG
jgi:hypothetical protein